MLRVAGFLESEVDFKVDISPEAIETAVTVAIVNSAIGKLIDTQVRAALNNYSMGRAIEDVIRKEVVDLTRKAIDGSHEFKARIVAIVTAKLTDDVLNEAVDKTIRQLRKDSDY